MIDKGTYASQRVVPARLSECSLGFGHKTKAPERKVPVLLARREGFEPPAFWSVGRLKGESEPLRLRFARFSAIRTADFPLFPASLARSDPILGQKWVKAS